MQYRVIPTLDYEICPMCNGLGRRQFLFAIGCKFCKNRGNLLIVDIENRLKNICLCPTCKGEGIYTRKVGSVNQQFICIKCEGQGWFDNWVECILKINSNEEKNSFIKFE